MQNTNEEIQDEIEEINVNLGNLRLNYKVALQKERRWFEAKMLHQEIKATELQIEVFKNRLG